MIPNICTTFWKRQNYGKSIKIGGGRGRDGGRDENVDGIFRAVKILCVFHNNGYM